MTTIQKLYVGAHPATKKHKHSMKISQFSSYLKLFGLDVGHFQRAVRGIPTFISNRNLYRHQALASGHTFPEGKAYPCLNDRGADGGVASGAYFHQDLFVAQRIFDANPSIHVDVGSRIDGFVAHVASFRSIEVVDIRPIVGSVKNITFMQANFMSPSIGKLSQYCDSASCLHALEHFGLGRYGDPVMHDGHLAGLRNLHALLSEGGTLYLSVPIGPQRVEFDAHRIFSVSYLLEIIAPLFTVESFSYVDDSGALYTNIPVYTERTLTNFGVTHGCGIFELKKISSPQK